MHFKGKQCCCQQSKQFCLDTVVMGNGCCSKVLSRKVLVVSNPTTDYTYVIGPRSIASDLCVFSPSLGSAVHFPFIFSLGRFLREIEGQVNSATVSSFSSRNSLWYLTYLIFRLNWLQKFRICRFFQINLPEENASTLQESSFSGKSEVFPLISTISAHFTLKPVDLISALNSVSSHVKITWGRQS